MANTSDMERMFKELTGYERKNVNLGIDRLPASPMQIIQAHIVCEDVAYMRDYVLNDKGDIMELWFDGIRTNNVKKDGTHSPCKNQ